MASGKKPRARRDVLRSCPHSGDRAAAAGCPRVLKPRARKSAALHAEFPHPYCASGPADRGVDQGTRFYRSRPVRRGQHRYCRGRTVCRRRGRRTWTALPCIPLADLPDASSLRFRSGRPARRSGLRFHAGMVRREASGARCEPAVGDVRSARAQLTADQGRLPPWQYPFPARRPQAGSTRETGVRQEIAGLHPATETARHPGNFFPVFCPEFPEKSGRDWLAAYCPHSQPHSRFCPLQIWSGFMPCYQQVENLCFRQRRFIRADIPPDTPKVSAGVFHHPFRVFRLE